MFRTSHWAKEPIATEGNICYYNNTLNTYVSKGYYYRVVSCLHLGGLPEEIPPKRQDTACLFNGPKPAERYDAFVECCNIIKHKQILIFTIILCLSLQKMPSRYYPN